MQSYWSRFAGGLVVFGALLGLQIVRVTTSGETPLGAVLDFGFGIGAVALVLGLIVLTYWVRSRDSRARRRELIVNRDLVWIGDVELEGGVLQTLGGNVASDRPRTYGLVGAQDGFELWQAAGGGAPVATIPFARIEAVTAPLSGSAVGAGQFEVSLTDPGADVGFKLTSPVLWGLYPATPRQVDRVVGLMIELVSSVSAKQE